MHSKSIGKIYSQRDINLTIQKETGTIEDSVDPKGNILESNYILILLLVYLTISFLISSNFLWLLLIVNR